MSSPTEVPSVDDALRTRMDVPPVETVADVLSLMQSIDAALPDTDGLKWFNKLYWMVTEAVRSELDAGNFSTPTWIARLDVVFARLYFEAVTSSLRDPGAAPRAWQPLLAARRRPGLLRLQFALAGMNAHINRDLSVAVVECCAQTDTEPRRGTAWFDDYLMVNDILERVEGTAMHELAQGVIQTLDEAMGKVDDVLAMWSIRKARDAAWTNAEILWALRDSPTLFDGMVGTVDRMAGFAGRGLLLPLGMREGV
jgi:hypothetical protein